MIDYTNRFIAIDTEYHTSPTDSIDKVYCISASASDGRRYSVWLADSSSFPNILDELASYFGVTDPIFICHTFDLAERQSLTFLGVDCLKYCFLDTFMIALAIRNSTSLEVKTKLSYSSLCKRILDIDVDMKEKDEMRLKCILDETEGHEKEIMAYCEHDTQHLIPLCVKLLSGYAEALRTSVYVKARPDKTAIEIMMDFCDDISRFGLIADRGLPVSSERVKIIRKNAEAILDESRQRFESMYNGTFHRVERKRAILGKVSSFPALDGYLRAISQLKPDIVSHMPTGFNVYCDEETGEMSISSPNIGRWVKSQGAMQLHMSKFLQERGLLDTWERTETGKLKTSKDLLKVFKNDGSGFGYDLYQLTKQESALKGIAQLDDSKNWLRNFDEESSTLKYRSLRPFASQTSRCQPKGSAGFVFSWHKALYSLLEPKEGKWLVELDYGSEEVFIQAAVYRDDACLEAYLAKDYYLWLCYKMGMIPSEDWENMPTSELKKKYHEQRSKMKPLALGWSYGMGARALAARIGRDENVGKRVKDALDNKIFIKSTKWKERLFNRLESTTVRGVALPDGWIIRSKARQGEKMKGLTSIGNFPIQGMGAVILRRLVKNIMSECEEARLLATIHDAIFFEVDEGDYETIEKVSGIMKRSAFEILGVEGMKVGAPEIIKHGEIWTPEHAYDELSRSYLDNRKDEEHEKEYQEYEDCMLF